MRPRIAAFSILLAAALAAGGCDPAARERELERRVDRLQRANEDLRQQVRTLDSDLARRERRIQTLLALGEKRLDLLFHVDHIKLGRYTAGVDLDDESGDDAVRVHLEPRDEHGSTIKAAGSVRIQLFDLAADEGEHLLFTCEYPVEKVADYWASGFITNHYKFDCRWKQPPAGPKVTVRVEFTDYLTGRKFTAQKVAEVKLAK
jgi:hypothetical protein